jgi:hypothetical protein
MSRWVEKSRSLKARFGAGAGLIGIVALLSGALTVFGMARISEQIDASLAAERRIARYAVLSTQISTFIIVATEAIQSGLSPEDRAERLDPPAKDIGLTFSMIRSDVGQAVAEARPLGFDEQSRRASRSIEIARMEALFRATQAGLVSRDAGAERARGHLDAFSLAFDPLLNGAVTEEIRSRDEILARMERLRGRLTQLAIAISAIAALLPIAFHLGLVRPQMGRLDLVRQAAQRIGRGDFSVAPSSDDSDDEIGRLFAETNRAASALARREAEVEREWARLNDTIAERTEELRAANTRLARTDEDRRRFFADISHELRTPLTVILMEAEIGLKDGANPSQSFEVIRARAQRLNRRIDDLLRIARSESGRIELQHEPLDLNLIVEEALAEALAEIGTAGMRAEICSGGAIRVRGDRNWLRQVIAGLVRNAVRHAREGGRIALHTGTDAGFGCVHVVDAGPGIDTEDQARVFDRFDRGRFDRGRGVASDGFGIGLALARWVIEQQGGRIALESPVTGAFRLGEAPGTMITACLPLSEE